MNSCSLADVVPRSVLHYEAIRSARLRLDCQHRPGPPCLRYALASTNEGYPDLPSYREPAGGAVSLLGHTKIESTVRYLGIEAHDALAIAEQVDV